MPGEDDAAPGSESTLTRHACSRLWLQFTAHKTRYQELHTHTDTLLLPTQNMRVGAAGIIEFAEAPPHSMEPEGTSGLGFRVTHELGAEPVSRTVLSRM